MAYRFGIYAAIRRASSGVSGLASERLRVVVDGAAVDGPGLVEEGAGSDKVRLAWLRAVDLALGVMGFDSSASLSM